MQDHKITLFHANWSFCSQMVRVALFELNIKFDERHIKLCDQYAEGENLDKNFLDINPLAYGHTLVVGPWGETLAEAKEGEVIVTAELDLNRVRDCQNVIPVLDNDRNFD